MRSLRIPPRTIPIAFLLLLLWALPAGADTKIEVSGQVRARAEVDKRSFDTDAPKLQYTDLRTRLGMQATLHSNTSAFVQLQDSRRLGGTNGDGLAASGTLNGGDNVDIHQAYLHIRQLGAEGLGLRLGRYELNLGNQRVFGSVGWHNVGRSWEGASLWYRCSFAKTTGYWLKRAERNDPGGNQDFDVVGLYAEIPRAGVHLFGFYEYDAEEVAGSDINSLDRADLGLYLKRSYGGADFEANGVFQTGKQGIPSGDVVCDQDISAFLVTAELGYQFSCERHTRFAAGVDYASGDSDPADDTHETYDNLYYTGHKFRGYMDYFLSSNTEGLIDLMGRVSMDPSPGWTLKADVHYFRTAQEYTDFEGEETSAVGWEVDCTVGTTRVAGVQIEGGASLFLPSDSYAGFADGDPGFWGYIMMTTGFQEEL